mgnify:CR=1 FL=1
MEDEVHWQYLMHWNGYREIFCHAQKFVDELLSDPG